MSNPTHPTAAPRERAPSQVKRYSPELPWRPRVTPPSVEDRDACAIYASVRKDGTPSREPVQLALENLQKMLHRAGNVDGEGDGCGILVDIPRLIWAEEVRAAGANPSLVLGDGFAVAHVFIERSQDLEKAQHDARQILAQGGFRILAERVGVVNSPALGSIAREDEPHFWQIGGLVPDAERSERVFDLMIELEEKLGFHVPSFSASTCVYKVMGAPRVLGEYYPDLHDERFETVGAFGHNRYSTNTWPSFKRVQPFSVLGHNGEINTIAQLRQEARMLGAPLRPGSSDSQDLNRVVDTLIRRDGLSLAEAMEAVVPPIVNEIRSLPAELHPFYMYLRQAMGPFAQGPVALIARHRDECVFSADAMGLRPLWKLETPDDYIFSSEPGVVSVHDMVSEPLPLGPGEKFLVTIDREKRSARLYEHAEMQRLVARRWAERTGGEAAAGYERALTTGGPLEGAEIPGYTAAGPSEPVKTEDRVLAGFGWQRDDVKLCQQMASNGAEPIGSLGYDGPLAALSPERQNLADYFKETVAVVTNPAIDREREMEHFSTRAVFGHRPSIHDPATDTETVETSFPVILGGHHDLAPLSDATYREIANKHQTYLLEDLWEGFRGRAAALDTALLESETSKGAIERLRQEAVKCVSNGAELLVLTDRVVYEGERRYLDPHLALSAVDQALKQFRVQPGQENLRRRCSIVLRSAAVRNVHDVVLALGMGANGVCPYVMVEVICVDDYAEDVSNLCAALRKGIEKVISTIGIHEVRGYARQFSSIGVGPELAEIFQTEAFAASDTGGVGFADLDADTGRRQRILAGEDEAKPAKTFRFYPKVYKAAVAASNGSGSYGDYSQKVRELEAQSPISMRHIMGLNGDRDPVDAAQVDAGVGHHDYPLVISSMSFGSQSEPAFRAYAEAAKRINILCINGEGGEIQDMYGHYRKWRGQQVASGRFGVSAEMLNSSYVAEIKIGQGAKPGEGGHLPGKKVSEKVAAARNASPGTDLISPSNNHDLYSIEDLAELIDELKTVNPDVRVSVKVPVVPNVGTIGLGIAKAGADIITLSGFEGGTGAARQHALRHVGLPSDIGTRLVHQALMEAGIRNRVEIWADGGYRHAHDVAKLLCMGANRVAFGTLAMVSLGCTICRGCQLDTCHVGIATQIETTEEAQEHGLKKFTPQTVDGAAESCARFFQSMGEEVKEVVGSLGYDRAQDLVGRYDLLEQVSHSEKLDLTHLITPLEEYLDLEPADLPSPVAEEELVAAEARAEAGLVRARPIRMAPKEASAQIAALAGDVCGGKVVHREFPRPTDANDRVLGTELAGALSRGRIYEGIAEGTDDVLAELEFNGGSVAGQGFGAFNAWGVVVRVEGGAQDGVGKTMLGGTVSIMKGRNAAGERVNGSVGKSFAYGAQRGRLFVQGSADSRFCIRLSGADVVLAGEPAEPLDDSRGCVVDRANAKGFAFEYMTSGRAVVLGDIGPWACAGMTGGRVYVRVNPEWSLDREAIARRLGEGAKVWLEELDAEGGLDLEDLLGHYAHELRATDQDEEAERITGLAANAAENFLMIIPEKVQADPNISTE